MIVSDVRKTVPSIPATIGVRSASPHKNRDPTVELADVPEGEFTQERPQRRRCERVIKDRSHRPVSQQCHVVEHSSAPATMPATSEVIFRPALAPLSVGTIRRSSANAPRPHCCANATIGTSPAHDTRFGSSNIADATRRL